MKVVFYAKSCDDRKIGKDSSLTQLASIEGTLRRDTSIINPTIRIQMPQGLIDDYLVDDENRLVVDDDWMLLLYGKQDLSVEATISKWNYAYIEDFGNRYYFIRDIASVGRGLWDITMRCDVLMTYKDDILSSPVYLARAEYGDGLLDDDKASFLPTKTIKEEEAEGATTAIDPSAILFNNIAVTHFSDLTLSSSLVNPAEPPINALPNVLMRGIKGNGGRLTLLTDPIGATITDSSGSTYQTGFDNLVDKLTTDQTVARSSYLSAVAFPFEIPVDTTNLYNFRYYSGGWKNVGDGLLGSTPVMAYPPAKASAPYVYFGKHAFPKATDFTELEPHTVYDVFLPFVGWVRLLPSLVNGKTLHFYYAIDYETGSATAYICDGDGFIYHSSTCQMGMRLSLTATDQTEIDDRKNSLMASTAIKALTSAMAIIGGIVLQKPLMVAGGIAGGISSVMGATVGLDALHVSVSQSFSDPSTALYQNNKVIIRKISDDAITRGVRFKHLLGLPVNEPMASMKSLPDDSFIACSEILLTGGETDGEKAEIRSLLSQGVWR